MYDYIIIGSSIPCLLTATTIKKNVLIIEKENNLGGAWGINCDKYNNLDLVGHLIVPKNNETGNQIINYFKNINLELEKIKKKDFYYETENFSKNNKNGDSIIAKYGWVDFYYKILNYVKTFNNIKIIKNIEVLKIEYTDKNIILNCNTNNYYYTDKVIIPMYCSLNKIYYNNTFIEIPYENIINKHLLIDISFKYIGIGKNYQAFLDKEPIGVFDRVTVAKIESNNCILSCRISKKYKNLDVNNFKKLIFQFLKKKKILNDSCKINSIYCYNYKCCYRSQDDNRNIFYDACDKINKFYNNNRIYPLNSIYMGHFLEDFIKNKLNTE